MVSYISYSVTKRTKISLSEVDEGHIMAAETVYDKLYCAAHGDPDITLNFNEIEILRGLSRTIDEILQAWDSR